MNLILDWIIHSNDPELPTVIEYELQPVSSFRRPEPTPHHFQQSSLTPSSPSPSPAPPQIRLRKQPCEEEIQITINTPVPIQAATVIATLPETNVEEPVDFEIVEMPEVEDAKKTS